MNWYEILEWVYVLAESMTILVGMFMISRYVFLEPSLEDKIQKRFYLIAAGIVILLCLLVGDSDVSIIGFILCGVNIVWARKKHKIRGFFNVLPICGFLNGIYNPLVVVPVEMLRINL